MQLSLRQERIVEIVKRFGPITGQKIAEKLNLTRAAIRPDLTVLTMSNILEARPRVGYYLGTKPSGTLVAEEIKKIKVSDVKGIPQVIRNETSVFDAIVAMFLEDVGTLIVVDENGKLDGVVSRKDLLKSAIGGGDLHKMPVSVIMTRWPNIICTTAEESVLTAARKIIEHEVDALPVIRSLTEQDEKLEVVGRLTKTTISRLFVELGEAGR